MKINPSYWSAFLSLVTTVDTNDATGSEITTPWERLEGPDLGLVEELDHFEDGELEG